MTLDHTAHSFCCKLRQFYGDVAAAVILIESINLVAINPQNCYMRDRSQQDVSVVANAAKQ